MGGLSTSPIESHPRTPSNPSLFRKGAILRSLTLGRLSISPNLGLPHCAHEKTASFMKWEKSHLASLLAVMIARWPVVRLPPALLRISTDQGLDRHCRDSHGWSRMSHNGSSL